MNGVRVTVLFASTWDDVTEAVAWAVEAGISTRPTLDGVRQTVHIYRQAYGLQGTDVNGEAAWEKARAIVEEAKEDAAER